MGHYMDVQFNCKLNDIGMQIISCLYEKKSWIDVCYSFNELHPNIFAGINENFNVIPFSPHSSLKNIPSNEFNPTEKTWKVNCCFKWKCNVDDTLKNILKYIISEPIKLIIYHELWDKEHSIDILPVELEN